MVFSNYLHPFYPPSKEVEGDIGTICVHPSVCQSVSPSDVLLHPLFLAVLRTKIKASLLSDFQNMSTLIEDQSLTGLMKF